MFDLKDYPSFLKQAYRFGLYKGFEDKIEKCLQWHEERHLPDAFAWRLKIGKLREQERLKEPPKEPLIKVVDEEKSFELKEEIVVDLKLFQAKPIATSDTDILVEGEEEKYYLSQVSKNKLEKANRLHSSTLNILSQTLLRIKCAVKETKLIDAYSVVKGKKFIFEVKSINEGNEREQIRKELSQLYEYRFLYSMMDATLCVVFSQKPFSQWLIDYLLQDRQIMVLWVENGSLAGSSLREVIS